jgi:Zn finger protein HypA/HybF involved in hydrogenase expression
MKTAGPIRNNSQCEDCGTNIEMSKYQYGKLCRECKGDRRQGNAELRQIFKDLQKRKNVQLEEEDWSSTKHKDQ